MYILKSMRDNIYATIKLNNYDSNTKKLIDNFLNDYGKPCGNNVFMLPKFLYCELSSLLIRKILVKELLK